MAQGQKRNKALVPEARSALYQFKYETANELGIQVPQDDYWGTLSSRDCGAVGGNMVRKMIQQAQQQLAQRNPQQQQ
jgi:hypothetical protein